MKINCVVISDSKVFAQQVQKYIQETPELNLVDMVDSPVEALKIIETHKVNLIMTELQENKWQPSFFFADVNGGRQKISYKEIVCVESAGNYVMLIGKTWKIMVYKSMSAILELLPASNFIRIHKSFIVSVECIDSIKGNECIIRWNNEKRALPIGNTFKENFLTALKIPS